MPLPTGTHLGPYEILAPLGVGGMGEVYRARDGKLDRDVAVKVLPSHLSADPEALARFEREAKAVAALSHPNILAIHDFGRDAAAGVSYAVMELLEGDTLRARVEAGPLPPKKVVQIGADIAQGLSAAHARGIVHRDLKPENVFVTTDGRVKILDFGLARPMTLAGDTADSPTALRRTDPGTVLGTVGYMSPEQVKGQPADHRSDLFSLGCVLYELATGRRAFQRETAAETMTAILREDPPEMTRDSGSTPALLEPVIRHCLEKQPDERFQSARDLAFALQSTTGSTISSGKVAALDPATAPAPRRVPVVVVATAALLVAGAFVAGRMWPATTAGSATQLTFQQLTDDAGVETDPMISPDGTSFAFVRTAGNKSDIYVQRIGGRNAIAVAADPALAESAPAFSPDGTRIAFHVSGGNGGIFVAGATGESAKRVTDFGFHPAWSADSQRLAFCSEEIVAPNGRSSTSPLWVVDANGGTPAKISDGDGVQPAWSPSGARIAYWAVDTGQRDIYTMPSTGGPRKAVTLDAALDWAPRWSADGKYLYFSSDRGGAMNIWRVAIDEATGATRGQPEPVTQGVVNAEMASLAKDGTRMLFRSATTSTNPVALPFDAVSEKTGAPRQIFDRTGNLVPTSVSPDGQWLALWNVGERQEDLFVVHPDGTGLRRVTDDVYRDRVGVFSPDGKEIAFYSNRTDNYSIFAIKPDGSGLRKLTDRGAGNDHNLLYPTYSPSGDLVVASHIRSADTIMFDPRRPWADQKPEILPLAIDKDSWLIPSAWSPDGRRLGGTIRNAAGATIGIGVYDVALKVARKVIDGASASFFGYVWLADSRRLVYVDTSEDTLWLVDVDSGRRKALATGLRLGQGLALAPDGRTLYVSTTRQQADIWMATTSTGNSQLTTGR